MKFVEILGYHLTLLFIVKGLKDSLFSKTAIIINTCARDYLLQEIKVEHRLRCSMACSQDADCRRYLYCKSDLSCKTYLDGTDCVLSDNSGKCSCYRKKIGCYKGKCTCPLGYYGNNCQNIIKDCREGFHRNITLGNTKKVYIQPGSTPFEIICNFALNGNMQILRRDVTCLHENFNRTMDEYKTGFGNVSRNMWIGLERLKEILSLPSSEFRLVLSALRSDKSKCRSHFTEFQLGNVSTGYSFGYLNMEDDPKVIRCGNPFGEPFKNRFSTYDQDNTGSNGCATRFGGGWWFDTSVNCTNGFLTGSMDGSGVGSFLPDDLPDQQYKNFIVSIRFE
ncbi:hypothetical protein SNE40_020581 [Patella caerulea]|uniref:Fibrinogen C-terminal domain-containing protein n=1 Tax=Patella caerulea TaxID=87958 RepID=A0AAN8J4Q8_PATCE